MSCIHGKYYMPTPLIPGHEAAGKVVEVGSAVTYCEVGDHVILSTFGNCGHCSDCEVGDPGNCAVGMGGLSQPYAEGDQALFNFANIGAFVQETIVAENQCIPIPKEMPADQCGPHRLWRDDRHRRSLQPCPGTAGRHLCRDRRRGRRSQRYPGREAGRTSQIIAIDRIPEKEKLATEFGATDFILAEDDLDMVNAVKQLSGGGVHHAFEVVGHTGLLADAINMTRAGGNVCAVGVPDLTATVTYNFQSLHQNKNLMGIRAGGAKPRKDFRTLTNLYMNGQLKLDEMISNTAGLDGLIGAFDAMRPEPRPARCSAHG